MRTAGREDFNRPGWSVSPAGHKRTRPPISVVAGVSSLVASGVWIAALTPPVEPSLTLEMTWGSLLFSVVLIVGILLGVRVLWAITWASSAIGWVFLLVTAIQDPQAQAIGGVLLLTVGLVCLQLPSALQFEQRQIRLVLDYY